MTDFANRLPHFFEWLNSSFGNRNETCQNCHMPDDTFKGTKLQFLQIANIEDQHVPRWYRQRLAHLPRWARPDQC